MLDLAPYTIAISAAVAAIAVFAIDALRTAAGRAQPADAPRAEPPVRFLFDRGRIVDQTASAELFLARSGQRAGSLKSVIDLLRPRFPDIGATIESLGTTGQARLLAVDGSARLAIARNDLTLRLDLEPVVDAARPFLVSAAEVDALKAELQRLRLVTDTLGFPVWCEDSEGRLTWMNRAYLDLCEQVQGAGSSLRWPLPRLFEHPASDRPEGGFPARLWIGSTDNGTPFEVTAADLDEGRAGRLFTAIPAEGAVRAETSMRDVLQTLTKTFAQISLGLAVFGRDRRLVLFNPALADLTGLRPESLAARPGLFEFLDLLRDRRMVPEPRDYRAWRSRLTDAAAHGGPDGLCESWALPDGRTFQVTALPQPEGATALLFEDITGQVVRNRNFRGTVELQQMLLDRQAVAQAVFAPDGTLALSNDAYDRLWGRNDDGAAGLEPIRLSDSLSLWIDSCAPCPAWTRFPAALPDADGWAAGLVHRDGRAIAAATHALPGGYLLVEFRVTGNGAGTGNRAADGGSAPGIDDSRPRRRLLA